MRAARPRRLRRASAFDTHGSVAAPNQTTEGTTTTETTVPTATTTSVTTTSAPTSPTPEPAETTTSSSDWLLIAIEGLIVVGFIALGVRSGGIGLGLWGGVGTLILVFGFGLDPGEPPFDAMLIIVAVISAAAAMQAAGGIDYMVQIASKALRARPSAINFVAPYVSYLLCILTGTSNTFFSIIPVINEVSFANKIRPERTLGSSTVASAMGITSSPVAAAMATLLPLVEVYHYNLVDVLLITIPASIVGIFVMSLVMSRHGKDLEDDAEYLRRVEAGEVQPPAPAERDRAAALRQAERRDLPRRGGRDRHLRPLRGDPSHRRRPRTAGSSRSR